MVRCSPPVALEVKPLAIEALDTDLPAQDFAEIVGVAKRPNELIKSPVGNSGCGYRVPN